jgi:hypothetical protein
MNLLSARETHRRARPERRGAALMLSMLVLMVLILVVFQIKIASDTDARVARNDEAITAMDLAVESALLQVFEDLKLDAENDAAAGEGGGGGGMSDPFSGAGGGGGDGGEGEGSPADSKEDDWARPQRHEIGEIQLRIVIQDEESKYNVLAMLTEDEDEAEKAFERFIKMIEFARKGTRSEIDPGDARTMASEARELLTRRKDQLLPKAELLTDDEEQEDYGLPLTLREFVVLDSWTEDHFRDYRDEDETIVHSLGSFLTVSTALTTRSALEQEAAADPTAGDAPPVPTEGQPVDPSGGGGGDGRPGFDGADIGGPEGTAGPGAGTGGDPGDSGQSGVAVNINTAPPAVLKALMDDRDVPPSFWDAVIEYRNTEKEDESADEEEEPVVDEFGEEVVEMQFFDSLEKLNEVDGWMDLEPIEQGELTTLLTTQSNVFTIFVTARSATGEQTDAYAFGDKEAIQEQEEQGAGLVRTVRCMVWRRGRGDGTFDIVPLERWELIDYLPFEVQDLPEEER